MVVFASITVFVLGVVLGFIEVFFLKKRLEKYSFTRKLIYKILIYGILLNTFMLLVYPLAASLEMNLNYFDPVVWNRYLDFVTSQTNMSVSVQMAISMVTSLFYAEISDNIGNKVLINFFIGKYHRPVVENRVFMFLDMKSSTTIAEQLGHIRYFELLKDYYADLSEAVIQHGGEIYQYVGDEIIVSWQYNEGIRNNKCIRCFFSMKSDLQKNTGHYQKKYGVVPSFKAGLHFGEITTGEIGIYKKDILFSGDVLNAASRIQGLCNDYKVDILISSDLKDQLQAEPGLNIKPMGKHALRGKVQELELFTVTELS